MALQYTQRGANLAIVAILVLAAGCGTMQEGGQPHNQQQLHAEKGRKAAEHFPGYASLCDLEMEFRNVNRLKSDPPRASTSSRQNRSRSSGGARDNSFPPTQVFDNLYFVGNQSVSSWLLGTDEGYILIDAMNTNDDAKSIIEAGILALGLDPNAIEYLLISHAHGDHYGGYQYLKQKYAPRIVMSEADWNLASQLQAHPRFGAPPEKDYVVNQGDQLTAGSTILDVHVTMAHTPGTVSPVFTVYDNGTPHRAMLWGGTGFNFGPNLTQMNAYAASAQRMKGVAMEENVTVFLSNHGRRDGSLEKMKALSARGAGDPHPFVMGSELLDVFDVLEQCALAQADRIQRIKAEEQ